MHVLGGVGAGGDDRQRADPSPGRRSELGTGGVRGTDERHAPGPVSAEARDALIRLVGTVLAEQSDEWTGGRRHMSLELLAKSASASSPPNPTR
jgi:hypothetical protein